MFISPPKENWNLLSGAVYMCNSTNRGFMCLLWESTLGLTFIEHGHAFLGNASSIVGTIRVSGTCTLVTGDIEIVRRFKQIRASSGTRLVWEKK